MKRWVETQLTKRSLWGFLPRPVQPRPEGPPLVAFSFDLDYQEDSDAVPALLDLLAESGSKATLFSIGRLVEADPEPYRRAAHEGHEIGNHTYSHPDNPRLDPDREFWHLRVDEMREQIGRCQDAVESITGARPVGFRTPHFKDAFRMMEAVAHFPEINYISTALASRGPRPAPYVPMTKPRYGDLSLHYPDEGEALRSRPLMIPLTQCPGVRGSPFCSYTSIRRPSNPARRAGLHTVPQWEELWEAMLRRERQRGFASVYFDPKDVMRDAETVAAFRRMISHALRDGWSLVPLREIERRWRAVV